MPPESDKITTSTPDSEHHTTGTANSVEIPSRIVDIWQRIVDAVSSLLCVPSVMINRIEGSELEIFRANSGAENPLPTGTTMPLLGVYCESTAATRQRNMVEDARKDPAWADSPTARAGIFSYLGYPVCWPGGDVFGTICAVDTKSNKWIAPSDSLLMTIRDAVEAHLALLHTTARLDQKNRELEAAFREVDTLKGLLPICVSCKKIRDDKGYWVRIEKYISDHSQAEFSHGICLDCSKKLYPDLNITE